MEDNYLVFCDADEEGNITEGITGNKIIPQRQYDYFFYLGSEDIVDLIDYRIERGKLVRK